MVFLTSFLNTFNFQDYVFCLLLTWEKTVHNYTILTPSQVHTNFLHCISSLSIVEGAWIATTYGVLYDIILYF